jgi:F-type H+-transporting ATPase subunit a
MAIPAMLGVLVWFIFNAVGIAKQGLGRYLKNNLFPPGMPKPIYILATPIEFVSTFLLRPFTLAVRLTANMIAGHLMLAIFFLGTWYMQWKLATIPIAATSFALGVFITGFEVLVAVLQAYIFTILTAVYISGAIHPEH